MPAARPRPTWRDASHWPRCRRVADGGGPVLSHPRRTVVGVRTSTDLRPTRGRFRVVSEFEPSGDQPAAIQALAERVNAGETDTVLLGATGTGKSATTAWLIEQVQRPTLVMAPNKTLAAQLANEFRELLPNNA